MDLQRENVLLESGQDEWIIAFFFFLGKGLVCLGLAAAGAYYALN